MGGWSGGVYSRFRNWVTDKANSINPQAALFDQEDDGFAAGLNNCVTKDGLNKPSSAMDWNGQNLTGVLAFTNTGLATLGSLSVASAKFTVSVNGNTLVNAPVSGNALSVIAIAGSYAALFQGGVADSGKIGVKDGASTGEWQFRVSGVTTNSLDLFDKINNISRFQIDNTGICSIPDNGGTFQTVGWRDLPPNVQAGSYAPVLADRGKMIVLNGAAAVVTIPANASVAFPVGTSIVIANGSGTNQGVAITTDTLVLAGTALTGSRTLGTGGLATITKVTSTVWYISGAGVS